MFDPIRLGLAAFLALAAALLVDWLTARSGYQPPGFRMIWRRVLAIALLAVLFFFTVFAAVVQPPSQVEIDPDALGGPTLFAVHAMLLFALAGWLVFGFAGLGRGSVDRPGERVSARSFVTLVRSQVGLIAERPWREIGIGCLLGIGAWVVAVASAMLAALLIMAAGGQDMLPTQPPDAIPVIASLAVLLRLALALSAGVVEEIFFRGFLQPRIGIALSTVLFVIAHASYGQPFMLIQIAVLSVLFALIVVWRRNVLAAIAAHATFDAVQLLIVIPLVLNTLGDSVGG